MTDREQRKAAKEFTEFWKGKGYEKGESQTFWLNLLRDVYGVDKPQKFIVFEDQVRLDRTSFIDGSIAATHVLIEQKGLGKDLKKPIKQSDGSLLTPFQQAKRYAAELPYSKRPRWIVTCNFACFHVYDMEKPTGEPAEILLENLPNEYYRLNFLVDTGNSSIKKEMEISIQAGELVGRLYDAILKRYKDPSNERTLKSLNMLCVRLVFCLYAEDAGIFGRHGMFHDYLRERGERNARRALIDLFDVLDTEIEDRDPYLDDDLAAFPYVNGGLFIEKDIEIPQFDHAIFTLLLSDAGEDFNWSMISPTIFGAVFESTLNPATRRSGGMHYTSIENIHKVIDPLFLDDLRKEFDDIQAVPVDRTRMAMLKAFQVKIAGLVFLDPACGSGNFLTETYIALRRLENETIRRLIAGQKGATEGQITIGGEGEYSPIKVSIAQFYGIEINDFAVSVAKTALWIAESQMMKRTEDVVHTNLDFLPLKSYANIVEGNALRIDWETVVPKAKLNYIMGNPPFIGKKEQSKEQKSELMETFNKQKGVGVLDYVTAWYKKAEQAISNTSIRVAFVSTNSISQGEQPSVFWESLIDKIKIDFAYRTFKWSNEAKEKAAVHCVIIGFSQPYVKSERILFDGEDRLSVTNINPYLVSAPNVLIRNRIKPLCRVPEMSYGSMPIDNGALILSKDEKEALSKTDPQAERFVRRYVGGDELLNNTIRYCLWLKGFAPHDLMVSKFVSDRVRICREFRKQSNRPQTKALADTPHLFGEIRQPESPMLVIPKVSSENRKYLPIGFLPPEVIVNGSALIIPSATLYHFGILSSNVHNAWMRAVCGRLEMRYQYSINIVHNNFPWPDATDDQKILITKLAQSVLDARALFPNSSLSALYNPLFIQPELLKAHQNLDRAVMRAYGFDTSGSRFSEADCVAALMQRYLEMTAGNKS